MFNWTAEQMIQAARLEARVGKDDRCARCCELLIWHNAGAYHVEFDDTILLHLLLCDECYTKYFHDTNKCCACGCGG